MPHYHCKPIEITVFECDYRSFKIADTNKILEHVFKGREMIRELTINFGNTGKKIILNNVVLTECTMRIDHNGAHTEYKYLDMSDPRGSGFIGGRDYSKETKNQAHSIKALRADI